MKELVEHNRFIKSAYVGRLDLGTGVYLLSHVLGNRIVLCPARDLRILDAFQNPGPIPELPGGKAGAGIANVIAAFLRSNLLRPSQVQEDEAIREVFGRKFVDNVGEDWRLALPQYSLVNEVGPLNTDHERVTLSKSLAVLSLDDNGVLVTHPLARRLHLDSRLWLVAQAFAGGATVTTTVQKLSHHGFTSDDVVKACNFLLRKQLLSKDESTEQAEARRRLGTRAWTDQVMVIENDGRMWEQKFRPYTIDRIRVPHRRGKIAVVGYCQVHAYTPAFLHMAEEAGWDLRVDGALEVPPWLADEAWDLVILGVTHCAAQLFRCIGEGQIDRARQHIPEIVSAIDFLIDQTRSLTVAPILIHSIGRPGLLPSGPATAEAREVSSLLAQVNQRIATTVDARKAVYQLDEDAIAAEGAIGLHWDDAFNAIPHHSCISLWSRPPRHFFPSGLDGYRPVETAPIGAHQGDPASPIAAAYLTFLLSRSERTPVRMIVFEPNGLLWPGRLESRSTPYPRGFNFYTGDQISVYLGINEALSLLSRRGTRLACVSSCPRDVARARWKTLPVLRSLVRFEDCEFIEPKPTSVEQIRDLLAANRASEENVLWIDLTQNPTRPSRFKGRVYNDSLWNLRRYLLRAPEMGSVNCERIAPSAATALDSESNRHRSVTVAELEHTIASVMCEHLRCSRETLSKVDDLRLLGLDSLGASDLLLAIEERTGLALNDSDAMSGTLFSQRALQMAFQIAFRRTCNLAEASGGIRNHLTPLEMTYDEWCGQDLRHLILEHAHTATQKWIFKILRSTAKSDHVYVTWRDLILAGNGYARMYQRSGLNPGDTTIILLPMGLDLAAAIVGAILGRQVPAVYASPNPKLSPANFAAWFSTLVRNSLAQLIVCDRELAPFIEQQLVLAGVSARVVTPPIDPATEMPALDDDVRPDTFAILQYSSGTTALKKAVMLTHRALLSQIWLLNSVLKTKTTDVIVSWLPLYHDMGMIACFILPLLRAIPTVLISPFDWVREPVLLFRQVSEEQGTLCWLPNFAFHHCERQIESAQLRGIELGTLRAIVSCAEPITIEARDGFYRAFAPYGMLKSALASSYALAEATFAVTQSQMGQSARTVRVHSMRFDVERVVEVLPEPDLQHSSTVYASSGHPLPGVSIAIMNSTGSDLGEGHVGEVAVKSPSLMTSYFNDRASTERAIRDGWYFTGDIGFILDGELFVTGRQSDVIIVAGSNVHPEYVEESVSQIDGIHPGRVVAIGLDDNDLGTQRLIILAETDTPLDELTDAVQEAICQRVREVIVTHFAITPHDVRLLAKGTLIKSTSGKFSRRRNAEHYEELFREGKLDHRASRATSENRGESLANFD